MKNLIYWLAIILGTIIVIVGLVSIVISAITFDKTIATVYGLGGGLVAILVGLGIVRTVEKSWKRYLDKLIDAIIIGF